MPDLPPTALRPPRPAALTEARWPADASAPLRETTIGSVLREAAGRAPHSVALIDGDLDRRDRRQWTYRELLADAEAAARALLSRFSPGERVAVWSPNRPEWVVLEFGAALAGLVLVTVNPAFRDEELAYVLGDSAADGVFLSDTFLGGDMHATLAAVRGRPPRLREVISFGEWAAFTAAGRPEATPARPLPAVAPSSSAQVIYTSGTTGRPKGAVLTHRGLTNNARLAFEAVGVGPGDVEINPMPLFHVGGSALFTLGPVQAGAAQVLMPRFSPALELELIETYRVSLLCGVPTMFLALLGHPDLARRDVSALRRSITGGAVSPPALARRVEAALGVTYSVAFAQTEAGCVISASGQADDPADRAETLGRPLPQVEVRIARLGTGATADCGETGEICARGYLVMTGYLNDPAATAAAVDADGWLHTGDLGAMDDRGYLRIAGRLKEMIIRGGENIYPREIEEVLTAHPGVADAAVLGVPDEYYGEVVGAAIRPAAVPGASADDSAGASTGDSTGDSSGQGLASELDEFCRSRLAPAKVPVRWLVTGAFPLTASGKIRKDVLREQLARAAAQPETGQQQAGR